MDHDCKYKAFSLSFSSRFSEGLVRNHARNSESIVCGWRVYKVQVFHQLMSRWSSLRFTLIKCLVLRAGRPSSFVGSFFWNWMSQSTHRGIDACMVYFTSYLKCFFNFGTSLLPFLVSCSSYSYWLWAHHPPNHTKHLLPLGLWDTCSSSPSSSCLRSNYWWL